MSTLVVTALRVVCLAYLTAMPPQGVPIRGEGQAKIDFDTIDDEEIAKKHGEIRDASIRGAAQVEADLGIIDNDIESENIGDLESSEKSEVYHDSDTKISTKANHLAEDESATALVDTDAAEVHKANHLAEEESATALVDTDAAEVQKEAAIIGSGQNINKSGIEADEKEESAKDSTGWWWCSTCPEGDHYKNAVTTFYSRGRCDVCENVVGEYLHETIAKCDNKFGCYDSNGGEWAECGMREEKCVKLNKEEIQEKTVRRMNKESEKFIRKQRKNEEVRQHMAEYDERMAEERAAERREHAQSSRDYKRRMMNRYGAVNF